MSRDRFCVDLEELADVVSQLSTTGRSLSDLGGDVDRVVASLQAEWTGLAATAQAAAHHEWRAGMSLMREALVELTGAADRARVSYDDAALANLAAWRQVGR